MARFACADWIGPTVNEGDGDGVPLEAADAMGTVIWAVLHIQEGTEAGTEAWQRNPASQVSSHFLLPKVGRRPRQMVDTHDRSWCQVAGNRGGISMECEGHSGDALTADQLEQAAQIVAEAHRVHGLALQVCDNPNATTQAAGGVGYHAMGGTAWGGHFDCPGTPIIAQRPAILARAQQILGGDTVKVYAFKLTDGPVPDGLYYGTLGGGYWWMPDEATNAAFKGNMTANGVTIDTGLGTIGAHSAFTVFGPFIPNSPVAGPPGPRGEKGDPGVKGDPGDVAVLPAGAVLHVDLPV